MKQVIKNYSFSHASKTITFTDFGTIRLDRILLITDVTNNTTIYQFNNASLGGTVSTNVLTLDYNTNTGSFSDSDALQIFYDVITGDPTYDTPVLSLNAAKETGGNLATLAGAVSSGKVNVNVATGSSFALSDGTNTANVLKSDGTAAGQNALIVAGTYLTDTNAGFAMTGTGTIIPSRNIGNYSYISIQLTGTWTGTIQPQFNTDGSNFTGASLQSISPGSGVSGTGNMTANGQFNVPKQGTNFRLQCTVLGTGTVVATVTYHTIAPEALPVNIQNVQSASATGSSIPANAFYIGGLNGGNLLGIGAVNSSLDGQTLANALAVKNYNSIWNGTNYDQMRTATAAANTTGTGLLGTGILGFDGTDYQRISTNTSGVQNVNLSPSTTGGWTYWSNTNTALSNTKEQIKGTAGKLGGYIIYNPNAAVIYIQVFDLASASVTVGTTVASYVLPIAAGATANVEFANGISHGTGITVAATTTQTGSTAPGTALPVSFLYM